MLLSVLFPPDWFSFRCLISIFFEIDISALSLPRSQVFIFVFVLVVKLRFDCAGFWQTSHV